MYYLIFMSLKIYFLKNNSLKAILEIFWIFITLSTLFITLTLNLTAETCSKQ